MLSACCTLRLSRSTLRLRTVASRGMASAAAAPPSPPAENSFPVPTESVVCLPEDPHAPLPLPADATVFSMIQPTGTVHLGNYLGALRPWQSIQDRAAAVAGGPRVIYGIADLHALTVPKRGRAAAATLAAQRREAVATLLACGIDPERATVAFQSGVAGLHTELFWQLSCLAPMGYLNRMTQWKDKRGGDPARERLGLFAYPVLMAADILVYRATHVPVGDDQSQHLELTRYLAERFNAWYECDLFPLPQTLYCGGGHGKKVRSLTDPQRKMSKSSGDAMSLVYVTDSPEQIRAKVRKARTDSISDSFYFDPEGRPGVSNLLDIVAGLQEVPMATVERDVAGLRDYGAFKGYVADVIVEALRPVRERYARYSKDTQYLQSVVNQGNAAATEIAAENMRRVRDIVGLTQSM